jgi:hypothetical protein
MKFTTWGEARVYFLANVLPTLPLYEDETVEDRFMNWIEAEEIVIEEAQDTADSDAYDLATHN